MSKAQGRTTHPNVESSQAAIAGQHEEVAELFRSEARRLISHLRGLGADQAMAEDVCQDSFYALAKNQADVAFRRAYLYRVATDRLRRAAKQQRQAGQLGMDVPDLPTVGELAAQVSDTVDIVALLRRLPRREREVVAMRLLGDLSVAETAWALRIAEGTVKGYLSAGVNRLRRLTGWDVALPKGDEL